MEDLLLENTLSHKSLIYNAYHKERLSKRRCKSMDIILYLSMS